MKQRRRPQFRSAVGVRAASLLVAAVVVVPSTALADESGVGFWLPGFFGSLSAAPLTPGWSISTIYYHADVSASGNAAVSKQITIGQFNPTINVGLSANVHGTGDIGFVIPQYVFETKIFGGQAAVGLAEAYGREQASLNATFTAGPIPLTRSLALSDTTFGFSDLIPQFSLRWNLGVNNVMTYITGEIPIGTYNAADFG
jgi:hypothetical protein